MGNLQTLCNDSSRYDHQLITGKETATHAEEQPELSAQSKKEIEQNLTVDNEKLLAEKAFLDKVSKVARFISVEEFNHMISPKITSIQSENSLPRTDTETKGVYHLDPLVFLKNNNVYHGSWNEKGEMEGNGQYLLEDGHFIEGVWNEGHFVEGRVFQKDGIYYQGKVSNEMANGKGTYVSDDIIYNGEWKNNKKDGQGDLIFRKDFTTYTGMFKDDEMNGLGTIKWADGNSYTGNFENSMLHGQGMFFASSGATYEGDWVHNAMDSKFAVYTWPDPSIKYTGEYKQGKKEGYGVLYQNDEVLAGHWKDNKIHGVGDFQMGQKKYKLMSRFGKLIENSIEPLDKIEPDEENQFGHSAVYQKLLKMIIPLENDISDYKPSHLKSAVNSEQTSNHEFKPTATEIQNYFESLEDNTAVAVHTAGFGFNTGGANITMETNANGIGKQTVTVQKADSNKKTEEVKNG